MASVVLTENDLIAIRNEVNIALPKLKTALSAPANIFSLTIPQIKAVIKYLKGKYHTHILCTGTKDLLVSNLASVICNAPRTSETVPPPGRTIYTPPKYAAPPVTLTKLDDPHYLERQSPFFEEKMQLMILAFEKHDNVSQKKVFIVDPTVIDSLKRKEMLVHVRFYSRETMADIPWNVDVKLSINNFNVDLLKLARKIRSKPFKDPYILPRPVDVTSFITFNNTIEFCHPGECGICIVQLVKEKPLKDMLAEVQGLSQQTAVSTTTFTSHSEDIQEVNYALSMRCPLSYTRILIPAKGKNCQHAQCFDFQSFLDYCNQQQLWQCPVCSGRLPYKNLIIDSKFEQILSSVSHDVMQVIMHQDGTHEIPAPEKPGDRSPDYNDSEGTARKPDVLMVANNTQPPKPPIPVPAAPGPSQDPNCIIIID